MRALEVRHQVGAILEVSDIEARLQQYSAAIVLEGVASGTLLAVLENAWLQHYELFEEATPTAVRDLVQLVKGRGTDIILCSPNSVDSPLLASINSVCLDESVSWVQLSSLSTGSFLIGPLYIPGQTACYECFRLRYLSTHPSTREAQAFGSLSPLPLRGVQSELAVSSSQAMVPWTLLLTLLSYEALDQSSFPMTPLRGQCLQIDMSPEGMQSEMHRLLKVPRCEHCNGQNLPLPQPWNTLEAEL